jgi:hypothetical protein
LNVFQTRRCRDFQPPLQSKRKWTCGTIWLGGNALTAPQASRWKVRPRARYVTIAVPLALTASLTPEASTSTRSPAVAADGASVRRSRATAKGRRIGGAEGSGDPCEASLVRGRP